MIEEQGAEFESLVDALVDAGLAPDSEALGKVAQTLAKLFSVDSDEVAILRLDPKGKNLRFVIPEKLAVVGSIPLSSATALAARTARERRPEVVNNFNTARHATVFEGVPLGRRQGESIHKIMSAPILVGTQVCGVVQISRKGRSSSEAGADFTQKDLRALTSLCPVLCRFVKLCPAG
jgi:transcriptional regulator with GAF, ATPase, and Fis domain